MAATSWPSWARRRRGHAAAMAPSMLDLDPWSEQLVCWTRRRENAEISLAEPSPGRVVVAGAQRTVVAAGAVAAAGGPPGRRPRRTPRGPCASVLATLWGTRLHASHRTVLINCGAGTICRSWFGGPTARQQCRHRSQRWAPKVDRAIPASDQGIAIRLTRDR